MFKIIKFFAFFFLLVLIAASCKTEKEIITNPVVDNYIYEINGEQIYASSLEKDKQKSDEQYISILYANLFQNSIPQNELAGLTEVRQAIGDKQLADELFLNSFINNESVNVPTDAEMRADVGKFIEATYLRFFLRLPTAYEVFELQRAIEEDEDLTAAMVYQGFALSTEYKFY